MNIPDGLACTSAAQRSIVTLLANSRGVMIPDIHCFGRFRRRRQARLDRLLDHLLPLLTRGLGDLSFCLMLTLQRLHIGAAALFDQCKAAQRQIAIGAAIRAGPPFLRFYCPGCQVVGEIDLRRVDRHRGASVESLIPQVSCTRCSPHPPFAKLIGLRS